MMRVEGEIGIYRSMKKEVGPMEWKKSYLFIPGFVLFLLFVLLSACVPKEAPDSQSQPDKPAPAQPSVMINDDGSASILYDGNTIGGAEWLSYPNADQVDFDAYFDTTDKNVDREAVEQLLGELWALRLGPNTETPDYSASRSDVADLCVDFTRTTGEDPESETDYLFASTDRFYIIWFQDNVISFGKEKDVINEILGKTQPMAQ